MAWSSVGLGLGFPTYTMLGLFRLMVRLMAKTQKDMAGAGCHGLQSALTLLQSPASSLQPPASHQAPL